MELTDLPNIGPKLAESLRRVGVDTPERFQDLLLISWLMLRRQQVKL